MKILIVDDHMIVRQGLKQILADEFPGAHFGEAPTATLALSTCRADKWDIILLDLSLPDRGGLEVLEDIRREYPLLPVLILSMHPEAEFAIRAIKSGAAGYLTKQSMANELITAIRKACQGEHYITASLAEHLATGLAGGNSPAPLEALSNREFQTLRLLAQGKSVKEIGGQLNLSAKTVSTYRTRVLEKLHLKTTVDLARYALEHDLID